MSDIRLMPLTHAEHRIYFAQKMYPDSCMWNVAVSLRFASAEASRVEEAVRLVIGGVPGLRTRFAERDGVPGKYLADDCEPVVERVDFSGAGEDAFMEWATEQSAARIPMLDAQPYRMVVADAGGGTVYLYTNYHHIIADGGSSDFVFRQVAEACQALERGETPVVDLPHDLAAAHAEEERYLASDACAEDKAYWNGLYETVPEPMDIAGKPTVNSLAVTNHSHRFSPRTTEALMAYCGANRVSPFRVVLATMATVLSRTLRREDIVIGTATANRHPQELRPTVGMYVSTSAMRMQVEADSPFGDVVGQASEAVRGAVRHERYPYDMLAADIRARTGEAPDLIACTLVEMVRTPYPEGIEAVLHLHHESLIPLAGFLTYPHRDAPAGSPVELDLTYNVELYEPWRIRELGEHIENAVLRGVSAPDTAVAELDFLGEAERERILEDFNDFKGDWPVETTVHECIAHIARRYPGHNAAVYRGAALTYAELDARSNALARVLRANGAKPGTVVGLLADRSLPIVVAQLAILKSGAAFMPIDAEYPDERIRFMLSDIAAPVILTQPRFIAERDFGDATVVNMDDPASFDADDAPVDNQNDPHDLCAVIYTSGSTGKPKGVLLEHRSIANIIHAAIDEYDITSRDKISKHASFSFDASMLEVFTALMSGAELHLIPEEIRLSLSHLNEYYETHGVTWAFLTTQLGEQFMEHIDNSSLRVLAVGGEKLRVFTKRKYQLYNIYGPTECSIYATQFPVHELEDNIPIGTPVPNYRIHILDAHGHPQPAGFAGELCIAGPGVGRGYHQRPDKTAECFVPNPFAEGETLYRTGDLACWDSEGNILHLGRIDRQVKLRGFRIELGEIENAMLAADGVTEAAVGDFKDSAGHVYLCGYFCGDADPDAVREALGGRVPPFMVPAHMMRLDAMPVNPSGKIDRKKLPEPDVSATGGEEYVEPQGELEIGLTAAWAEVLEREQIGAEADFFKNGGDSLRAVALQLTIQKRLGREVELSAIFECPTPRAMARKLKAGGEEESITPAPQAATYPATVAQQQLYLLSRMQGIGTAYNMPLCIALTGELDHKRLSAALLGLLDRHEALRTAFEVRDGKCVQRLVDDAYLKLEYQQTTSDDPAVFAGGFVAPFDLSRPPLMRARLVAHEDGRHWLLLDFHHIAFDGVSVGIFLRELMALYAGAELAPLPIQHKDFAAWEAGRLDAVRERHEGFWFDLFAAPPEAELPTDFPRPGHQTFEGANYRHLLSGDETKAIRALASRHGATMHQVFMAALGVLTGRWSDSEDVCLGTSMSGRDRAGTAGVVGMFVRTLPARVRPERDKTFAALLAETREQMMAMHEHGEYPISSLYEHLGVNRGPGRHPLFDVNFVMRNTGADNRLEAAGLTADIGMLELGTAKFDLSFAAQEEGGSLVLDVDYRTALYSRDTVARMTGHLCRILAAAAKDDAVAVGDIVMLGPEERESLLTGVNPAPTPAPQWPTVAQAVSAHAAERPDHTAVVAADGSLTYAELDALSSRAARAVRDAGGGSDAIVGVVADRSIWAVVGMLAAIKSGSAYVGLDTHYPQDRVDFILEDTAAPCVLGTAQQLSGMNYGASVIALDGDLPAAPADPDWARGGTDLAYCIFTSGSTGKPKGVLIEHEAMVNFINWYATHHGMTPQSGCAAFAAFSFDVSVVQVFAPLVSGSTLHVIPEDLRRSPVDLDAYFVANGVTHAHFPTQFAEQYMRLAEARSLTHMIVGGDRLRSYRLGGYRLTNEYGPSETAMACLSYDVPKLMPKPPVGTPVANTRIYIMDSQGRLCPTGMPGEICVAGAGVGRGYLNRPDLTDEHFVADPFVYGARMFRTGDKGRWLPDGTVDFIGRMDFQVKIRGYRVEPGEIEARIKDADGVRECVVVPLEEPGGNKVLAAYLTADAEIDEAALKAQLKQSLPEYMVPAHVVQLEAMPLSPNGKVDRGKLPRPEVKGSGTGPLEPRNAKEKRIAEAWEKVLGHKGYGLFDSFFDVGGDSLSAIALLAELSESFDVGASDLFAHTTIAEQAARFVEAEVGRSARLLKLKALAEPPAEDEDFAAEEAAYAAAREQDAALDTDATISPEHVLLTGATGTLGVYLLRELLAGTEARVTAVVRAADDDAARTRLAEHVEDRFGAGAWDAMRGRVDVLRGDLAAAGFGMTPEVYSRLEAEVDTIVHSAALTSHYGDWEVFVAANITSVENLAAFARTGRPKAMHHLSTTSVCGGSIDGRSRVLFTEFDVDKGQQSGNLYVRSKLEAEMLLVRLRAEGQPVSVYRAGNITCDSETGVFQRNVDDNAFYQQLRAYVNFGVAPDALDARNMTYVDQAARAVVLLLQRPGLLGQTFHIQNPRLLSLSAALSDDELGLALTPVPFTEFIDFFAAHAGRKGFDEYVERLLVQLGWQDWLADPSRTAAVIRPDRTADLLARCGFTWKTPGPEDLRLFVAHALAERVQSLAALPGLADVPEAAVRRLAERARPESFVEGDLLQREGRAVTGVRFVMDGMVETFRHNQNGWVGTVRVGGPGGCVGEEGLVLGGEAVNSVEALDETFAFGLAPDDMRMLIMEHPELGLALLRVASTKADQAERLFVAM